MAKSSSREISRRIMRLHWTWRPNRAHPVPLAQQVPIHAVSCYRPRSGEMVVGLSRLVTRLWTRGLPSLRTCGTLTTTLRRQLRPDIPHEVGRQFVQVVRPAQHPSRGPVTTTQTIVHEVFGATAVAGGVSGHYRTFRVRCRFCPIRHRLRPAVNQRDAVIGAAERIALARG